MRRLLFASAALLGLAGSAHAAGLIEFNPSTSPPTVGDATGTPITSPKSGFPQPALNPDPGKIIIRLDGFLAFDTGFIGGSQMGGDVYTAGVKTGHGKLDSFTNNGLFRLYFGADGQLLNGLRYGVNAEMRTNFAGPNASAATYTVSGSIGNASGNSTASLWYTRRAFGYVGTPQFGYLRFGQGDGPLSIFTASGITTGEAFSTGAWDGDVPDLMPGNVVPTWQFYDVGNEYTSNKITYLSPTMFGAQVAFSYAPNSSVLSPESCGSAAGGACLQQSSSALGGDLTRPRNIIEAAVRWQGNLGPVAVDSMIGYAHSGVVNNGNFLFPGTKAKGVDVIDGGASLTFLGASLFAHANTGTQNGTMTPVAVIPGRGSPKGTTWTAGAQYATGPWTVGASYYYYNRAGSAAGIGNETFRGEAVGGDYNWAPGFDTFLEYLHGERRQAGVNYLDSGTGVPAGAHNHVSLNGIALTMLLRW